MPDYLDCLTLYVGDDQESEEACAILASAGFRPDVAKVSPTHPRALYGTPVLFGLGNRFDGLEGVRVFIENSTILARR